jgi:Mg-chelatase subunit ChlI
MTWETRRPLGHAEEWRILAKEAAEEQDPEKLMEIIDALNRALDEQDAQRKENNLPRSKRAA